MKARKSLILCVIAASLGVLGACAEKQSQAVGLQTIPPEIDRQLETRDPTATPGLGRPECWGSIVVKTYLDANRNAVWDADEQGLAGINIVMEDLDSNYPDIVVDSYYSTDERGILDIGTVYSTPNCASPKYRVYPNISDDYIITTAQKVEGYDGPFIFGLYRIVRERQ